MMDTSTDIDKDAQFIHEIHKERRRQDNKIIKLYLKGRLIWPSKVFKFDNERKDFVVDTELSRGTYVKVKHGPIGSKATTAHN